MLQFHAMIHGDADGRAGPLIATFDDAMEALAALTRLFIEPDGSFVWVQSEADGTAWQVDGNLLDQGPSLAYVEIAGRCPEGALDQLLAALGSASQRLIFQLPRQSVFLDEAAFRRLARSPGGAI